MIILSANNLSKIYGTDVIIDKASFHVNAGDRVGIVGRNGAGKTTLLNMLTGELGIDEGEFFVSQNTRIGYLKQRDNFLREHTVREAMDHIFDHLHKLEDEIHRAADAVAASPEDVRLQEKLDSLQREYDLKGGYTYKSEITGILSSMAFGPEFYDKKISSLSGGERTRLALAALLLEKPDLLLLDEPTNHLDIDSCEALEDALFHYDGTLLIVSHDRYLINKLADRIYYLEDGGITEYLGNYDDFLQARREKEEAARQNEEKAAPKINLYKQRKEQEAELRRMRTAVRKTEERIEETDEAMAACAQALQEPDTAADFEKAMELSARMEELRRENDRLMAEWEALSAQLEEKEKAALS